MDKVKICEAMYALPGDVVVRRRKSALMAVLLLVAGVAVLMLNGMYAEELSNNLRSAVVLIGSVLTLTGMILAAARFFSTEGAPYYPKGGCFLRYEERYYDRVCREEVLAAVAQGDLPRLKVIPRTQVPALVVATYESEEGSFAAMQAFEYADLEYRPLSDLKIVQP